MYAKFKRLLFGQPLPSHVEHHERLGIPLALAVFASDALSSTAYATEEILIALVGTAFATYANILSLPVAAAICLLIITVVISYRQVIRAFPEGGGTYLVAKENLGIVASLTAGAALLLDYVLTVAVSISAGVAALTSTRLVPHESTVGLALFLVAFIMLINLRGVRESGKVIAFPAYVFILSLTGMLATGFWKLSSAAPVAAASIATATEPTSVTGIVVNLALILALLNAFSHGCAALTGIEAISDGVKAFKPPEYKNANRTMVIMGCILGAIFLGTTYLAFAFHIVPSGHETVVSQVARAVFGDHSPLYYLVQFSTMVILILAANTSFSGFPRMATFLAYDGFLPRQLMNLGDKLVFSNGILLLGFVSAFLIWAYHADTHSLIPLYAVGVFLSFTLAQAGMVIRHLRNREKESSFDLGGFVINLFGAIITGLVTILLAVEKFWEGAWIILIAIPLLIFVFLKIYYHYKSVAKQLILPNTGYCPVAIEHTVLVLVSSLNRGTIPALEYARTISDRVEAIHIELNTEATENLKKVWHEWGCGVPLVVLQSPYRSISEPLMQYIDEVEARYEHDLVTIIIPEFVTKKFWHNLLHNQTALLLKTLLRFRKGKVVTTVRYHLEE
jgi:amino acid transporter